MKKLRRTRYLEGEKRKKKKRMEKLVTESKKTSSGWLEYIIWERHSKLGAHKGWFIGLCLGLIYYWIQTCQIEEGFCFKGEQPKNNLAGFNSIHNNPLGSVSFLPGEQYISPSHELPSPGGGCGKQYQKPHNFPVVLVRMRVISGARNPDLLPLNCDTTRSSYI